jgi:lipopolysaccharide export system protein LptC
MLAAVALAMLYFARQTPTTPSRLAEGNAYPLGYYMRDAVLLGTDDEGRVTYRLHAGLAEERPEEAKLVLENVRFEYQPAENTPWSVVAARGEAPTSGEEYLDLEGDVQLTRNEGAPGEPARVQTNRLRLEPKSYLASAAGAVHIAVAGQTLDAVGLKAFLKDDRLELESQVHGRVAP